MNFVVEPIMGGINTALNTGLSNMGETSKVLVGLILGGMMAIDMGGPFNKAAYVFGTASIAAGNYDIMAAVMIGGMTPPCAIALATLLFKNKFTKEQRETGPDQLYHGTGVYHRGRHPLLRLPIRSMCSRPASQVQLQPEPCPWRLTARLWLPTAVSSYFRWWATPCCILRLWWSVLRYLHCCSDC